MQSDAASIPARPANSAEVIASTTGKYTIHPWRVEDPVFWKEKGRKIALRNLVFSIFAEFLGFSVWQIWSAVAVNLPSIGFKFSLNELFWLAALPGLVGATLRLPYAWAVPIVGGRNFTIVSVALLLLPTLGVAYFIQRPDTPYAVFLVLACLCGFGGGNFASSMANINYFFPRRRKGLALGLNAAGGNFGVSVVQFAIPIAILYAVFGSWGGDPQVAIKGDAQKLVYLQNAGLIWVPLIIASLFTSFFFMNNLEVAKDSLMNQVRMFKNKHTWIMSYLYVGTFGSFIGYSAGLPLLIKSQFPEINPLQYAFLGPLVGSVIRPVGGWLSDKVGGAIVTLVNFIIMAAAVVGVMYFLSIKTEPGAFLGFFIMFLILFVTAGIGNGSTYRMIPIIYLTENARKVGKGVTEEQANTIANNQTTAVVGVTAAIGAYGAFLIPKSYGTSIELTGSPLAALAVFIAFYIGCIALTYWFYCRKTASVRC